MSFDYSQFGAFSSISTTLLLGIKAGDGEAWRRFVRVYGPVIYLWCIRSGLGEEDAADVGQEVFRAVAGGIGRFRRDRPGDTFLGWLRTITRYKVIDFIRAGADGPVAAGGSDFQLQMSQVPDPLSYEKTEGDGEMDDDCRDETISLLVARALEIIRDEFEERTWRAFWQTAVEGNLAREAAGELGMTDMAVRKAKSRVLRRLREELGEGFLDRQS